MNMKRLKRLQLLFLGVMLIVAMALCMTGCNGEKEALENTENSVQEAKGEQDVDAISQKGEADLSENVLGEGAKQFNFTVVDKEGNQTEFEIHTDKETVGEALLDLGLIVGEDGAYGLYVKTVNGITADYETDGTYWAFYVNDEYATSGVDTTVIAEGEEYSFKVE